MLRCCAKGHQHTNDCQMQDRQASTLRTEQLLGACWLCDMFSGVMIVHASVLSREHSSGLKDFAAQSVELVIPREKGCQKSAPFGL